MTIPSQVVFRDLDGEGVIVELETGTYYGLNAVGTRMWLLLERHGCMAEAFEALREEFEVSEESLRRELVGFVDLLVSRRLLETDDSGETQ